MSGHLTKRSLSFVQVTWKLGSLREKRPQSSFIDTILSQSWCPLNE